MAAPRKITDAGRKRILAVAIARRMLPTDDELAAEFGCTRRGVQTAMQRLLDLAADIDALRTVSRETISGNIARHSPIGAAASRECPASQRPSKSRTY